MKDGKEISPQLKRKLQEQEDEYLARADALSRGQVDSLDAPKGDLALPANQRHDFSSDAVSKNKEFADKIYLFPPSFNALRRELNDEWPQLFTTVNPATGKSLAYCMVYDAPEFVAMLNHALDMMVQMDSDNVAGICEQFLDALRKKRGLSALH